MSWPYENKVGKRYGKLLVIKESEPRIRNNGKRQRTWLCQCDCGNQSIVRSECLSRGTSKSCGCNQGEKHGLTQTPLYHIWQSMIQRCEDRRCKAYKNYGGRGIRVCESWRRSFLTFKADMGLPPSNYTLERKRNSGNYEPRNCRWATRTEQARNARFNRIISYKGERKCIRQWEDDVGLARNVLWQRLKAGWSVERALTTPQMW